MTRELMEKYNIVEGEEPTMEDLLELNERRLKAWELLKEWISDNCFFDGDTITYEDISDEMNRLEDKIYD